MTAMKRTFAAATLALACTPAAFGAVVGFDYAVIVDSVSFSARAPAGLLPVSPGNSVTGTFAFDTTLPASFPFGPEFAFYDYFLPSPLVAHHLRFQLPTPVDFSFSNVSFVVLNDYFNTGPDWIQDELMVSSEFKSTSQPNFVMSLFLISIGTPGYPLGPLSSLDLPTTPPNLADFNLMNEWNFTLTSADTDPFTNPDRWSISVQGHLASLSLAEIPEPSSQAAVALALGALVWQRALGSRRRRQSVA